MGRSRSGKNLYISVPSFFKCPISLDIMKSPVSLCTGVTYDRSSIQKWLEGGHDTCPATMQVLDNKEVIPNYTLRRLIHIWSLSNSSCSSPKDNSLEAFINSVRQLGISQVSAVLEGVRNATSVCTLETLILLFRFASVSEDNRAMLMRVHAVDSLVEGLQKNILSVEIKEQIIKILNVLPHTDATRKSMSKTLKVLVEILNKGSLDGKTEAVKLLQTVAKDDTEIKVTIANTEGLLDGVLQLCKESKASESCLDFLISLCGPKKNRIKVVKNGSVSIMNEILFRNVLEKSVAEKSLHVLELLSACTEGRIAISSNVNCVKMVVQKMLKVSDRATEHCVTILWALCCLSNDQKTRNAVVEFNGMTKVLLLMQSNCGPPIRHMAADMLKVFRHCSKSQASNFYRYESKATHIMPF